MERVYSFNPEARMGRQPVALSSESQCKNDIHSLPRVIVAAEKVQSSAFLLLGAKAILPIKLRIKTPYFKGATGCINQK